MADITEDAAWKAFLSERNQAHWAAMRQDRERQDQHNYAARVILHLIGEARGLNAQDDNESDDIGDRWLALWEEAEDGYISYTEGVATTT